MLCGELKADAVKVPVNGDEPLRGDGASFADRLDAERAGDIAGPGEENSGSKGEECRLGSPELGIYSVFDASSGSSVSA